MSESRQENRNHTRPFQQGEFHMGSWIKGCGRIAIPNNETGIITVGATTAFVKYGDGRKGSHYQNLGAHERGRVGLRVRPLRS